MALEAIPVTLVSGFLGSGKTTLVNHILSADHGLRIAVMVNDFGDINIDAALIVDARQKVVSLANGCICCSLETDLIEQLEMLIAGQPARPEYILIETSGISDPARVLATLRYPRFAGRLRLDNVITLVDAEQLPKLAGTNRELAMAQLTDANLVVINKADLVTDTELAQLRKDWLFPDSRSYVTTLAQVPLPLLFDPPENPGLAATEPGIRAAVEHDFMHWSWRSDQSFTLDALRRLLSQMPSTVYRVKGIVGITELPGQPIALNMVGHRSEMKKLDYWPDADQGSRLVMIATGIETDFGAIESALQAALSAR